VVVLPEWAGTTDPVEVEGTEMMTRAWYVAA
jgi:hypothetical protein